MAEAPDRRRHPDAEAGLAIIPPREGTPPAPLPRLPELCADPAKAGRIDDAIRLLEAGLAVIPPEKKLSTLYRRCADLMAKAGRVDDAIRLLEAGLAVIPTLKDLVPFYRRCGADKRGGPDRRRAIRLLLEAGLAVIPPEKDLPAFTLFIGGARI